MHQTNAAPRYWNALHPDAQNFCDCERTIETVPILNTPQTLMRFHCCDRCGSRYFWDRAGQAKGWTIVDDRRNRGHARV